MDYDNWKKEMRRLQIPMGFHYEKLLSDHFRRFQNKVVNNPKLPNGTTPDFLITDTQNHACYVEAKVLLPPRDKEQYERICNGDESSVDDSERSRIQEKLTCEIDEKYNQKSLQGTPLVIAFLDISTTYHLDWETETYGHRTLKLPAGDVEFTGKGIWQDEQGPLQHRRSIHGIWTWICFDVYSTSDGWTKKPTLATNPFETINLPDSIITFNNWTWHTNPKPGYPTLTITDGGMNYNSRATRAACKVHEYIQKSRSLAQQVRQQ